jgi:hypothetical protein
MDSPRAVELALLRATPTSWLAALEREEQSPHSRVTFLFESCRLRNVEGGNEVLQRITHLRRIRAFIELADKRVAKTPGFCMTRTEAVETAAYEFLRNKYGVDLCVSPVEMSRSSSSAELTPREIIDSLNA